ncbi:MAG TPA: response regulator [Gallionella sp.]|nr:response regulator [Gallionella sp.]
MKQQMSMLDDTAILTLTRKGERELREPGTMLTPAQLEALVLIDGHANVAQMIKGASNMAPDELRTTLRELVGKGLIGVRAGHIDDVLDPGDFFTMSTTPTDAAESGDKTHAEAEADANAEFLRRNGYYVNMARRPAVKRKRVEGRKLMVLVIDDDPDICKLLQMFLKLENIDTRTAANREDVIAALRSSPLPDMVLLDVHLTDINGFDVLTKMRQHPALKELPVIMLTREATRGAVLKGILGGADGYITKPFEIHPLLRAVKTVLDLKYDTKDQDWDYSL